MSWMMEATTSLAKTLIIGGEAGILILLVITIVYPFILRRNAENINIHKELSLDELHGLMDNPFHRIALALDYSNKDRQVIQYALQFAKPYTEFILIHIVESASAKLIGEESEDYETRKDKQMLEQYVAFFEQKNYKAEPVLGYRNRTKEIARLVKEANADLLIVGSHGHTAVKDFVLGETINRVRHLISIPVFIAQ